MSIWCSWREIGYDDPEPRNRNRNRKPQHGEVRSYATGFSNHYPTTDGDYEQRANVGISSIPVWCVPGHDEHEDYDLRGEWVRLDVYTREHDFSRGGKPTQTMVSAAVVMDEAAARALAADLLAWADQPEAKAR